MAKLLTLKKLEMVLKKHNLKQISDETLIPYNTLKNYSSGKTALDSIPYRYLEKISDYDNAKSYECFPVSHFIVSSDVFDKLVKECRKEYNPYYEYLHCSETFDKRMSDGLRRNGTDDKIYYFIDPDIFVYCKNRIPMGSSLMDRLPIIFSIGLAMGVRVIIRDNKYINQDEVVVSSSIDLSDLDYDSVLKKLELEPEYELPKLDKVASRVLLKELIAHLEYMKYVSSFSDRVDEALSNIDNVTPDTFN